MNLAIVVPWRAAPQYSGEMFKCAYDHLRGFRPGTPIILADCAGEFSRARALNGGIEHALRDGADMIVMCDADCMPDYRSLEDAIRLATFSRRLVLPYTHYVPLTYVGTTDVLAGRDPSEVEADMHQCWSVGGAGVIQVGAFLGAGRLDERFVGWGFEDAAFAIACDTILGRCLRVFGNLTHLWHPMTPRDHHYEPSRDLCLRYEQAHGSVPAMMRLIAEGL